MIESHLQAGTGHFLLTPNRSLSWEGNKLLLAAVALVLLSATAAFSALGAWMIAPFAGLELLALSLALYFTTLRQRDREVITFTASEVWVQKGRERPRQEFRFPREWARFVVCTAPYRAHPRRLLLRCHGRNVEIARHLSEDEKDILIEQLRAVVRTPVNDSMCGQMQH